MSTERPFVTILTRRLGNLFVGAALNVEASADTAENAARAAGAKYFVIEESQIELEPLAGHEFKGSDRQIFRAYATPTLVQVPPLASWCLVTICSVIFWGAVALILYAWWKGGES